MNKMLILATIAAALCGCQTRITAEKFPEQVLPIQQKVTVNGEDRLITTHYQIASGGWDATARSPLWAQEGIKGLDVSVGTNGTVALKAGEYARDLSTNAVTLTKEMFAGGATLIREIGEAYVKIAGGGAQASTVLSVAQKLYQSFTDGGGDPAKATVTENGGNVVVSDGTICTTCTPDGTCTTGNCSY